MEKNRLVIIGLVLVMVVAGVGGWVLGIQPELQAVAGADQDRANVATQNIASAAALLKLQKDYTNIDAIKKQRDALRAAVPDGTDVPAFVDELDGLAGKARVAIKSLTVSDAQSYQPPVPVAAPAAGSGSTVTPAPIASPTPSPSPVARTEPGAGAMVSDPKITPANFSAIPIQVGITGSYDNVLAFIAGLQSGARAFLVTTISSKASAQSGADPAAPPRGAVDATVGGFVYVLLGAGATPPVTK